MAVHKAKPLSGISLNYEVVGGTTAPTTFNKENTIWVNTSTPIEDHCFSYNDPSEYTETTKSYNQKWSVESAYLSNTGAVVTGDAYWNITAYIDISTGTSVTYTGVTFVEDNRTNICFYDSSKTLISVKAMSTGTNDITSSIPSGAHYLRMCVRKNDKNDYKTLYVYVITRTRISGPNIWFLTDIDNASISFNALKRNELMIYPHKCKQWNGSTWKSIAASIYRNSVGTEICKAANYLLEGGVVQSLAGGFTLRKQQYNSELSFPSGYMLIKPTNSGTVSRTDSTNKINWANYNKLCVKLGASDLRYSTVHFMIGLDKTIPDGWWPGNDSNYVSFYREYAYPVWSAGTVLEFDISNVTNSGILMIGTKENVGDLYIADIWVE